MRRFRLPIAAVCMLAGVLVWAQQEVPTLKVDVNLVNVLFSVRDKHGALVPTLEQKDLKVFEDGKEQTIKYFNKESDLPITMGLLVDISKSMENLIELEKASAQQFFARVLRPKDMAFIISFGPESELVQDYTNSHALLRAGLDSLRIMSSAAASAGVWGNPGPLPTSASRVKGTVLYDAVTLASKEKLRGQVGRKALIIITDGVDEGSSYTQRDALEAAQKADAIIYTIHYSDPQYTFFGGGNGEGVMKKLSEETGGHMFHIGRKQNLDEVFNQIQEEMRTQYMLAYTPTNEAKDGSFRKLEIRPASKDLRVQARKGYYAMPTENQ